MDIATIAAIATPTGRGGIGIIKISGKNAFSIAASVFKKSGPVIGDLEGKGEPFLFSLKSHRLYHGHIVDKEKGRVLDEVLLSVMVAPRTYTMEDVVEINTHSGPVVLTTILDLVLKQGAKLAEPGEFTQRAYLNGRIDLTQAEAVIDIINSKTERSLEIATSHIKGGLKKKIEAIRGDLVDILVEIETAIDFSDDAGESFNSERIVETLERVIVDNLEGLIEKYQNAHVLRDGLKMVVVGRPNVGKSSLMNRLIQEDRAIVTPIPGTTRDLIEETLNIHGIPVKIADTAGLHETDDPIEAMGIEKAEEYISDSDLILFMVDASDPLTGEDYKIYKKIRNKRLILVINKSDLVEDNFKIDIPDSWNKPERIKISALYGRGLNELKDLIVKLSIGEYGIEVQNKIIPNLRQKMALERSLGICVAVVQEIKKEKSFEFIAMDIKEALDSIGEIIGDTAKDDVIDQIFSRFCIGKWCFT
ncbi:MAG: tRNA modification GTPase [Desulfobacteraceae bacterium Eth-SRB2]|nr:MAG: tRNA modification GTPase [Desulfobacteraceae bacterium Eth-SRB2]